MQWGSFLLYLITVCIIILGNCGCDVPYGVRQGLPHHQGGGRGEHRLRDGGGQGGGVQGGQVPLCHVSREALRGAGHPLQLPENCHNQRWAE